MNHTRRSAPAVAWRSGGRGPALVLLNGWSASGLAWPTPWVRDLERLWNVIRIDNRGCGYSRDAPTPFTVEDLADDVAAVVDDAEVERATVFGLSMGGMVAQEFAMRYPDRLDGLVLCSTRPPTPAFFAPRKDESSWDLLARPESGESIDAYLTRLWGRATAEGFGQQNPEALAELVRQIKEKPTPRAMMMCQLRAVMGWGHAERLATVQSPTIVIHGAEDRLVPPENGRRLAELIPSASYVELSGVGHLPPLEAPDAVTEIVNRMHEAASSKALIGAARI